MGMKNPRRLAEGGVTRGKCFGVGGGSALFGHAAERRADDLAQAGRELGDLAVLRINEVRGTEAIDSTGAVAGLHVQFGELELAAERERPLGRDPRVRR